MEGEGSEGRISTPCVRISQATTPSPSPSVHDNLGGGGGLPGPALPRLGEGGVVLYGHEVS